MEGLNSKNWKLSQKKIGFPNVALRKCLRLDQIGFLRGDFSHFEKGSEGSHVREEKRREEKRRTRREEKKKKKEERSVCKRYKVWNFV